MVILQTLPRSIRLSPPALSAGAILLIILLLVAARALFAQVDGDRGIAPVMASTDIEVGGIEVDVRGDNAQDARKKGWIEAQRQAWAKLGGPALPDSRIDSIVSSIVIEREQIGPRRYIARLGVIFDRGRAGALLGSLGSRKRSAPMLLLPVTITGGSALMYENRNPWQHAWAEYQSGASQIDYIRPTGAGGDSLLLTYGQTGRRSRTWWRNVLDQYGATDVIVPIANLTYRWPGGPVDGTFTARYGPDNRYLDSFTLTAKSPDDLPRMMAEAVLRFDGIFSDALNSGLLRPDPSLNLGAGQTDPAIQRLLEVGRLIEAQERAKAAQAAAPRTPGEANVTAPPTPAPTATAVVSSFAVYFASPDGGTVDATLSAVRATPGVRGAATTSIAIGGTSVMSVSYGGSLEELAADLRARGFRVTQGNNALSIAR